MPSDEVLKIIGDFSVADITFILLANLTMLTKILNS